MGIERIGRIGRLMKPKVYTGSGRDVKRLLRRRTRCNYFKIIVLDSEYDYVRVSEVKEILVAFNENHPRQSNEGDTPTPRKQCKDCDDRTRKFWTYAKDYLCDEMGKNGIIGMTQFGDHAYMLFADVARDVYSIDLRTDAIRVVTSRPHWIMV